MAYLHKKTSIRGRTSRIQDAIRLKNSNTFELPSDTVVSVRTQFTLNQNQLNLVIIDTQRPPQIRRTCCPNLNFAVSHYFSIHSYKFGSPFQNYSINQHFQHREIQYTKVMFSNLLDKSPKVDQNL